MTGPAVERDRVRPQDRPAAVHQRAADAVRGGGGAGRAQRLPGRRRPGHRPGARRSSGSSGSSRSDGVTERHAAAAGEWTRRPGRRDGDRRRPRPHDAAPTASSSRAELVRQASEAGVRLFAITDHDNLAGYRELARRRGRSRRASTSSPASRSTPSRAGSASRSRAASCTCSGSGVDPDDEAFEAALAGQRARAARAVRRDAAAPARRRASASIAQVEALDLTRDDALGRPTVARALIAAGSRRRASRTPSSGSWATGMPGYVPRQGLGPVEAIRAIRAAGGLASLAHFPEAPDARCRSCATSSTRG